LVDIEKTIKEINLNFVIRYKYDGEKTKLIGAGQYHILVGVKMANRHFKNAFNSGAIKTTYKLRRGLKIDFCSK